MSNFLAFQEFIPKEKSDKNVCIWCLAEQPKNRAHIISKKLTDSSQYENILRISVCKICNQKCGEIEQWVLKNTPIGWVRLFIFPSNNKHSSESSVPSYYYDNNFKEWIVYKIKTESVAQRLIIPQLVFGEDDTLKFYGPKQAEVEFDASKLTRLVSSIPIGEFIQDIRNDLPVNFSPRVLCEGKKIILIARNEGKKNRILLGIRNCDFNAAKGDLRRANSSGREYQHFKWSKVNWVKFCAKIAFENLCLFEGAKFCERLEFNTVRSTVLSGISTKSINIKFNEKGPINFPEDTFPSAIDLSHEQSCPQFISGILLNIDSQMHGISIYELSGWICASVSILGLPSLILILGGPNLHLHDFYMNVYDNAENKFRFLKLAYNSETEIIPFQIAGNDFDKIISTYKLRPSE